MTTSSVSAKDLGVRENAILNISDALEGSMETLNIETAHSKTIHNDESDLTDDIDCWGEDELVLDREWEWRHKQFHTMGYREGITKGKVDSVQEGFNVGFKQAVHSGYNWGLVRGISSAYANLPDHMKEKLTGTIEERDRLLNLHQSSQIISTVDALKMFHESMQHIGTGQESSESNSYSLINTVKSSSCNQLNSLSKDLISLLQDLPAIDVNMKTERNL